MERLRVGLRGCYNAGVMRVRSVFMAAAIPVAAMLAAATIAMAVGCGPASDGGGGGDAAGEAGESEATLTVFAAASLAESFPGVGRGF